MTENNFEKITVHTSFCPLYEKCGFNFHEKCTDGSYESCNIYSFAPTLKEIHQEKTNH